MKVTKKLLVYGTFVLASVSNINLRASEAEDLSSSVMDEGAPELTAEQLQIAHLQERLKELEHEKRLLTERIEQQEELMATMSLETTAGAKQSDQLIVRLQKDNDSLKSDVATLEESVRKAEEAVAAKQALLDTQKVTLARLSKENERIVGLDDAVASAKTEQEEATHRLEEQATLIQSQAAELSKMRAELETTKKTVLEQTSLIESLQLRLEQAESDNRDLLNSSMVVPGRVSADEGADNLAAEFAAVAPQIEMGQLRDQVKMSQHALEEKTTALVKLQKELDALREAHATCGGTASEVAGLKELVQQKDAMMSDLRKEVEESQTLARTHKEAREALQIDLEMARKALSEAQTSKATETAALQETLARQERELASSRAAVRSSQDVVGSKISQISQLQDQLEVVRKELEAAQAEKLQIIADLQRTIQEQETLIRQVRLEAQTATTQAGIQKGQCGELQAQLEVVRKELEAARAETIKQVAALQVTIKQKEEQMSRLSTEAGVAQKTVDSQVLQLRSEITQARKALAESEAAKNQEIATLQRAVKDKQAEISRLQEQLCAADVKVKSAAGLEVHNTELQRTIKHKEEEVRRLHLEIQASSGNASELKRVGTELQMARTRFESAKFALDSRILELQREVAQGEALRAVLIGEFEVQRGVADKQIGDLNVRIRSLEQLIKAETAKLADRDQRIIVYQRDEQAVAQLKALRDRIATMELHINVETQVAELRRNFITRIDTLKLEAARKQAELEAHVRSGGSSFVGRALGAVVTQLGGQAAVEAGVPGTLALGSAAAASAALENRAQRLYREKKETLEAERQALDFEVAVQELALEIVNMAMEIRAEIKAAQHRH